MRLLALLLGLVALRLAPAFLPAAPAPHTLPTVSARAKRAELPRQTSAKDNIAFAAAAVGVAAAVLKERSLAPILRETRSWKCLVSLFPAKHEFFKHNTEMFASWRRKHCLPLGLELEFRVVLEHQWQQHIQYLSQEKRLTWKDVSLARALLHKHFIVHCEDHESNRLMVYCPQFYLQAAMKTCQDPDVFEPAEGSSAVCMNFGADLLQMFTLLK
eukprot:s6019_g1.t1